MASKPDTLTQPATSIADTGAAAPSPARLWNRNFLLLWQGQFVSRLGNQAFNIALVLWIVQTTGSATLTGLLLTVSSIPGLILGPIGGAIADRYSRRRIIILSDLVSGLFVMSLAAILFLAPQATDFTIVWLFVVSVVLAVLASFFGPAISAAVPDLVPKERISGANSMGQISMQVSLFVGQALGGTLFRVLGAAVMFLFDGLTFLFSAASESLITIPQRLPQQSDHWRDRLAEFKRDLTDGLRYVWRTTGLKGLVILSAASNFFSVPIVLLLPFYVDEYLQVAPDWYGFLLAAFGVGSLAGYLLVGAIRWSGRSRAIALILMMIIDAIAYGLLAPTRSAPAALGIALVAGCTGGFVTVSIMTVLQLTTPSDIRGRVFGLLATISGSVTPLAGGLSGFIADLTGRNIPLIYLICSAAMLSITIVVALNREIRAFLAHEPPTTGQPEMATGAPPSH